MVLSRSSGPACGRDSWPAELRVVWSELTARSGPESRGTRDSGFRKNKRCSLSGSHPKALEINLFPRQIHLLSLRDPDAVASGPPDPGCDA